MFTWCATSGSAISVVHEAAMIWATDFWTTGGYGARVAVPVTLTNVTTVNVDVATGLQSQREDGALALAGSHVSGTPPAAVARATSLRHGRCNRHHRRPLYIP